MQAAVGNGFGDHLELFRPERLRLSMVVGFSLRAAEPPIDLVLGLATDTFEHGASIVFDEGARCVAVGENGRLVIANVGDVEEGAIVVHDVHGRPSLAFALSQLARGPQDPTCIGVFREVERPVYGEAMMAQLDAATERLGRGNLDKLLHAGDTWTVS